MLNIISFVIGTVVLLIFIWFHWSQRNSRTRDKFPTPKGPFAWPIVGTIWHLLGRRPYRYFATELRARYGDVIQLYIAHQPAVVVNDYNVAVDALVNKYPKQLAGRPKSFLFETFMEGYSDIVAADIGPRWKFQRKLAHSALRKFSSGQQIEVTTLDAFNAFAEHLKEKGYDSGEISIDPYDDLHWITYNIMCRNVYGKVYSRDDAEFRWLRDTLEEANHIFVEKAMFDFIPAISYLPLPFVRRSRVLSKGLSQFMQQVVEDHRQLLKQSKTKQPKDITDYLLLEQQELEANQDPNSACIKDVHLRQTLSDLFSAGGDTSALTLYWMVGILASNVDIQERVTREIISSFPDISQSPTLSWKEKLPFTNATLQEIFRYSSIIPLGLIHRAMENCEIGGFHVAQNSWVLFNQYAFNFDQNYWKTADPSSFNPDRFIDSKTQSALPKQAGFMVFGCGRRVCLGEIVAKADLFLLLVLLCRQYRIVWSNKDNQTTSVVEAPDNQFVRFPAKYKVMFIKRHLD